MIPEVRTGRGTLLGFAASLAASALTAALVLASAGSARAVPRHGPHPLAYAPGVVVVGYAPPVQSVVADIRSATGARVAVATSAPEASPAEQIVKLPRGLSVGAAVRRFRGLPGVAYAVPDYVAHMAGEYIPNDPGNTHSPGGWRKLQWNFLAPDGVDAPEAWANLRADHRPGAKGVIIAVLDTGVAFRNWKTYRMSPDFKGTKFVDPCDLVSGKLENGKCTDPYPLDREGHGTFVAGTLAEATNNHFGVTGLAYNASIMPIRILSANGTGTSTTISSGIRYAVQHGAQVINLSLEFSIGVTAADIPDIIGAIRYAHQHGVVVVAAAGNDSSNEIAYPAHAPAVISVGATTSDRCLADYSNVGRGLDIVAPGGGDDTSMLGDPDCSPDANLPDVYQMTFNNPNHPDRFTLPSGWYGTSMSTPDVSAGAAMVIASRVLGRHPTPDQILARLEQTAVRLGPTTPNDDYGYGLLNIGAATSPLSRKKPPPTTTTTTTTTETTTATTTTTTSTTVTTTTTTSS
jgi:serine protease